MSRTRFVWLCVREIVAPALMFLSLMLSLALLGEGLAPP